MKKYMIPICMAMGAIIGLVIGLLVQFAWQIFACVGAAFGIAVGVILQLIWNMILPDAYFAKKQKIADINTSLFAKEEVEKREEKTVGHTFHEKNVQEEEEDVTPLQDSKEAKAARVEQERRAAQRRQWEELRAQRQQQAVRQQPIQRPANAPRQAPKAVPENKAKRVIVVEEDED